MLQGQALGRSACPSGRRLDQGGHVPADQVPYFGVADGPLQAETGDLKAASGKPRGQRVEGLLDVPRRQVPELDLTQPLPERLDGVPGIAPWSGRTCRLAR